MFVPMPLQWLVVLEDPVDPEELEEPEDPELELDEPDPEVPELDGVVEVLEVGAVAAAAMAAPPPSRPVESARVPSTCFRRMRIVAHLLSHRSCTHL